MSAAHTQAARLLAPPWRCCWPCLRCTRGRTSWSTLADQVWACFIDQATFTCPFRAVTDMHGPKQPRLDPALVAPGPPGGAGAGRGLRLRPPHALVRRARPSGHRRRPRRAGDRSRWRASGETVLADIENGPWPFAGRALRARGRHQLPVAAAACRASLAASRRAACCCYETFAAGNETVGKPSRPDFLLQPGELLRACARPARGRLRGRLPATSPPRFVQRIAAVRQAAGARAAPLSPARYPL